MLYRNIHPQASAVCVPQNGHCDSWKRQISAPRKSRNAIHKIPRLTKCAPNMGKRAHQNCSERQHTSRHQWSGQFHLKVRQPWGDRWLWHLETGDAVALSALIYHQYLHLVNHSHNFQLSLNPDLPFRRKAQRKRTSKSHLLKTYNLFPPKPGNWWSNSTPNDTSKH